MADIATIVEELSKLTVIETADLDGARDRYHVMRLLAVVADVVERRQAQEDARYNAAVRDLAARGRNRFAEFTARRPMHTLIIQNEVRAGGERFDWLVEGHLRPLHARLDRVIEAAVGAGQIRPIPAVHLASIAVGAIAHFFGAARLVSRLYDVNVQDAGVIEAHTHWVLEVLLHGLMLEPSSPGPRLAGS